MHAMYSLCVTCSYFSWQQADEFGLSGTPLFPSAAASVKTEEESDGDKDAAEGKAQTTKVIATDEVPGPSGAAPEPEANE